MANTKTLRSCIQSFWPYKTHNNVQLRILKYLPSLLKNKHPSTRTSGSTGHAAGLMWLWAGLTSIPKNRRGWAWPPTGGRPPLLLSWEVTEASFCLSDRGELHGSYGCGFRCDKSQRGKNVPRELTQKDSRQLVNVSGDNRELQPVFSLSELSSVFFFFWTAGIRFFLKCWTLWPMFCCLLSSNGLLFELC